MGKLLDTIHIYERLSKQKYRISIENGIEFVLDFDKKYYHHLVGFHYLTDLKDVASPPHGKKRFYRQLKNGVIKEADILKSELFPCIEERVRNFSCMEEIVAAGACKIIVEFDRTKAESDIVARFFLYKRQGDPLNKEPVTYYNLFIGYDEKSSSYHPVTYIVEHSRKYVHDQNMLHCKIEAIPYSAPRKKEESAALT